MGLALSGLASGFDWKSIVDQLIEVSRAPQNRMRKDQSANSTKTTALNEIKGLLSSFKSSLTTLNSAEGFQKKSAIFADTSTNWSATADTATPSGTYKFEFISEATASKYEGAKISSAPINKSNFLIDTSVGRTLTPGKFTIDGQEVNIPSTSTVTLQDVLTQISNLTDPSDPSINYTADLDDTGDQIIITKSNGGTITIGASNDTSNFLQAMRLSSGTSPVSSAKNWTPGTFTIDGVQLSISPLDSYQSIEDKINAAFYPGFALYDTTSDQFILTKSGGGTISFGNSTDTSNFLESRQLTTGTSPVSSSKAKGLSSAQLTGVIDDANLSSWTSSSSSFKINGVPIGYDSSSDSIQSVLNKINNSTAGVTATYDTSNGSIVLTNQNTGNLGIHVDATGDSGGLATALGLTTGTLTQGVDAVFKINGVNKTSISNTLDESVHGIKGLSVTAKYDSVTASENIQTIAVNGDSTTTKAAINTFVEKYNAVQNAIEKYTKVTVDGTKVSSAVLAGSRELATISRELRRTLYETGKDSTGAALTGAVKRLSDLGVGFSGIENSISITNSTTLDNRLASNSEDVIKYFTTANNGLVDRLDAMMDRLVNDSSTTPGTFKVQADSISSQNKSLDKQIAEFERR
ncbi:MAG: flagellar filament capping protein FliD, partial [Verrucomicrobia bacterium]|nr:flagellar filament capping protein FliD [Verrucomicrobiota bacterium]